MKKAILKTGVACLKIAYAPIRKGRVRDRITFISRQSDVPSMDIRMLADKLAEKHPDEEMDSYRHITEVALNEDWKRAAAEYV